MPTPFAGMRHIRKGTKSCWECKRRKIKCVYPAEEASKCKRCYDKRLVCRGQQYLQGAADVSDINLTIEQRLSRVETLLSHLPTETASNADAQRTPVPVPVPVPEHRPIVNSIARTSASTHHDITPSAVISDVPSLRSQLLALLPCQADIDLLTELSHGWWLVRRHIVPVLLRMTEHDPHPNLSVTDISSAHPVAIARLLLCIAICIQQLPQDVDPAALRSDAALEDVEASIISTLKAVTSNDALMTRVEGIECLILQSIYEVNEGNFHSSWLLFRKAISISQLLGMHRSSVSSVAETVSLVQAKRHFMWFRIVEGERYLSLLLGVPSATGSAPFPFDDNASWLTPEDRYSRQLGIIAGHLVQRNQGDVMHTLSATHDIDEKLTALAASMPQTWWETLQKLKTGRNDESGAQFECVVCQILHYEMRALTHLPFMLRAAKDMRFEYSRISCLQACRNLITTWSSMRKVHGTTFMSRLFDFQAYTAAITLLLGLFGPERYHTNTATPDPRHDDAELANDVAQDLESLCRTRRGRHEAINDTGVIHALLAILRDTSQTQVSRHLVVPHFGSVVVRRSEAVQPVEGERIVGAAPVQSVGNQTSVDTSTTEVHTGADVIQTASRTSPTNALPTTTGADTIWFGRSTGDVQFTSSQMPILDPLSDMQDMDWLFQGDYNALFGDLLDNYTSNDWEV